MVGIKVEEKHLVVHETAYRKGLALQREHYKLAKASGNFRIMRNCLENLKMELRQQAISNNEESTIKKIEVIIAWYDDLPRKFTRRGPEGSYISYPPDYEHKVNMAFTKAYELIITILTRLDLL